jgi:uncharacterized protein
MKKIYVFLIVTILAACTTFAKSYTVDEVPNVQLSDSTRLVSNPDNILSSSAESQINTILLDIRRQTSCEVAMVVIDDMAGDTDIDNFATDLFTKWGIGKKDKSNGVLIVVAKDAHKYVIRTGYGAEGVLPDVICGRIGRRILEPAFREDDYDGGLIKAAKNINEIMTDPDVRDELMSELSDDDDDFSWSDFLLMYFLMTAIMTGILAVWALIEWSENKDKDRHEKYRKLCKFQRISGYAAWFLLGMPLLVYLPMRYLLNRWRNGHHACPNCGSAMQKLDEETDNLYLTPAQDCEEKINSVDYDVWLCPKCGETDIYPYVNKEASFTKCNSCGARTCRLAADRIIVKPTTSHEGYGERQYICMNCGKVIKQSYKIPREQDPSVIILPGGGRGGFGGGGGGFSGGSFGGGMTGGGGASGGW